MSVADRRAVGERLRARRGRRGRGERPVSSEEELDAPGRTATLERGESWSPERHRIVSGEEVVELLPAIAAREPTSGYLFYDCQTDDARLVLTVLGEAERFGALCANRLNATSLLERDGRACGVRVRDAESGAEFELRASSVVNATGVWADALRPIADRRDRRSASELLADQGSRRSLIGEAELGGWARIRPSRGTHLTLRHEDLPLVAGAIVPAGAGRSIFALPWLGRTLVGTTDNDYEGPLEHVPPSGEDVEYLLDAVNEFFAADLRPGDVSGAYAGVRPLIESGDSKKSVDISRRAELYETSSGMITITGGKLTTWRRMAKLTVDRLVQREAREAPCRTAEIPLGQPVGEDELPVVQGMPEASRAALAARYGYGAHEVLALAGERPELAGPIQQGFPDVMAEVVLAARREQARSVGDVLLRRTRLGLLAARELCGPDDGAPARVSRLLAQELGWDERRRSEEAEGFRREAREEGILVAG
jgi:glycerol-3-phosphate dehydrogenase